MKPRYRWCHGARLWLYRGEWHMRCAWPPILHGPCFSSLSAYLSGRGDA